MNKRYILTIISFTFVFFASAQTSQYTARRDWLIGNYSGIYKDSTSNTPWTPCSFEIFYGGYWDAGDDSTIRAYFTENFMVAADSNLLLPAGFIDPNNTGRLKSNDSLYFRGISPSMGGGHSIFYKLKKISSTIGIAENVPTSNKIEVYPNPAQNYISVSLPKLFGEIFSYRIYGASGELIESSVINEAKIIDVSELPHGIYYLGFYGKLNQYNSIFLKE